MVETPNHHRTPKTGEVSAGGVEAAGAGPSRRALLGMVGGVTAGTVVGTSVLADPAAGARGSSRGAAQVAGDLVPFALSAVTLLPGRFRDNLRRNSNYLLFVDIDRLLHTYRRNVGLPSDAKPCGGWEAPDVELRGHSTGHLLSGLALTYAATGETTYREKSRELVTALAECQEASPASGFGRGYLSAFPESFFDRLEHGEPVWAPYYTIHKIMAGMLDQYELCGDDQARAVLMGMVDWVSERTAKLSHEQMQRVLRTEFGGMNEVLTNVYLLTQKPEHLRAAVRFDHAAIFGPLAGKRDQLAGLHANTQIPKIVGAVREYQATGDTRYRDIATFFWDTVVHHHSYVIGGNSNGEGFREPDRIASELSQSTCENCNSYNMLKLTRLLFLLDPKQAAYMDYYEWTLLNQMLGEQDPESAHGFNIYYTGLAPGSFKSQPSFLGPPTAYSSDYQNFSCDHGTGMETHAKLADSIYFHGADGLYVNLFIASEVEWAEQGLMIRQETNYPEEQGTRLTINGNARTSINIRVPCWVSERADEVVVRVNGERTSARPRPGYYLRLRRQWRDGDVVDVRLPMALKWRATPDNPSMGALSYGPVVLSGAYGERTMKWAPVIDRGSVRAQSRPLRFTAKAGGEQVSLLPLYDTHHQHYNVYWLTEIDTAPRPRLLARYDFDEGQGRRVRDSTGHTGPATLLDDASWVSGRHQDGYAIQLDGSGAAVSLPDGLLHGCVQATVALWVRLEALKTWSRVFDFGSGTGLYLFLTPRSDQGSARFAITMAGATNEVRVDAADPLPAGKWSHVAVTVAERAAVLYVDGDAVGRRDNEPIRLAALGSTDRNWLGRSQYPVDPALEGELDDLRIYSRALSAAEVRSLLT